MSTRQAQAARLCTVLVALVAMILSYHALALRASEAGIVWPLLWLYPLVIDGLLVIGMLAAYVFRNDRQPWRRAYVWAVIGLGLGVSLLGNALPALDPLTFTIRAMPPLALALALHLLILLNRPERQSRAPKAPPAEHSEQVPSIDVLALPSVNGGSGSAKARALLAERDIPAPELARLAGISTSRARAVRAEMPRNGEH